MATDSSDDDAVDALAFIELSGANISPSADEDAWQIAIDYLHEAAEPDNALLGEVFDEATRLA